MNRWFKVQRSKFKAGKLKVTMLGCLEARKLGGYGPGGASSKLKAFNCRHPQTSAFSSGDPPEEKQHALRAINYFHCPIISPVLKNLP